MTQALFRGTVMHRRYRPRQHLMRYALSWVHLDIDAMPRSLRLFSHNRFNLVSFQDRDHLDGAAAPLRPRIEAAMREAGVEPDGGAIEVLCMPRVLGHVFNPISVFFCHRRDGTLSAMLYEVHNTFGSRHGYLIPVGEPSARVIRQGCGKTFYVSPFLSMDLRYEFRVVPPAETVGVVVHGNDAEGRIISASFTGRRQALTDGALLRMVLRHGIMSLTVLAAIHWEALRLWLKGLRLVPRPAPPSHSLTIVHTSQG